MDSLVLTEVPIVKVGMLIRKPSSEVFEAFIDPKITTKFWFTKGSGRLEVGKRVRWDWEMYKVHTYVDVKEIEVNRRILMEWGEPGPVSMVEWVFKAEGENETYLTVSNFGFRGSGDETVKWALDSTGGFTTVIDSAKAWLEHKIRLNLVGDKFPHGH